MGQDGNIYCVPIFCLAMYYPLTVPWKYYKKISGGGVWNYLKWLFTESCSTCMWERCEHYELEAARVCHVWKDNTYQYHDGTKKYYVSNEYVDKRFPVQEEGTNL